MRVHPNDETPTRDWSGVTVEPYEPDDASKTQTEVWGSVNR